ncbi:MAG: GyrI-like domain-containing protein [Defluviitaleaceae bacterium]|nr:GyrI-like domain-containing protein [Defluviitaleaceae bacterium]
MADEPRIISKAFTLLGIEAAIDFNADFTPVLRGLYKDVCDKFRALGNEARMAGFWHMCNTASGGPEFRYFAGIEVDCVKTAGSLTVKELPESCYAVFVEQRRGQIGGPEGYAYKQWLPASAYEYNEEIPGDLEIFKNMSDTGPEDEAEIYIPVKLKTKE